MPSDYYKYTFVSASHIFARVKEELKSYFDTGAVDDLMFPIWTEDCLRKLGRGSYQIQETLLFLEDYQAKLPPDFKYVREAWLCTATGGDTYRLPGAYYRKITTNLMGDYNVSDSCDPCSPCPVMIDVVYKTTTDAITPSYITHHLLQPGNVSVLDKCGEYCANRHVNSPDVFDIRGNKFVTNFREGDVYLVYYSSEVDEEGVPLIPDNIRIQDYIRKYLIYQVFNQLWNQVTDETFNQIQVKYQEAQRQSDEAYVIAETEGKKQTTKQKINSIRRQNSRLNRYNIR